MKNNFEDEIEAPPESFKWLILGFVVVWLLAFGPIIVRSILDKWVA